MKYIMFVAIFNCCAIMTYGQDPVVVGDDPCDGKLYVKSHLYQKYPFNLYREFIENYVNDRYPSAVGHVQSYDLLSQKLAMKSCIGNSAEFDDANFHEGKSISVEILGEEKQIPLKINKNEEQLPWEFKADFEQELGYSYFGFVSLNDAKITRISKIKYEYKDKIRTIERSYFRDLFNPNFCFAYRAIHPMKVYHDADSEYLYIYITGLLPQNNIDIGIEVAQSYVAKIIVDLETGSTSRIVVPAGFLLAYGWMYCSSFWVM